MKFQKNERKFLFYGCTYIGNLCLSRQPIAAASTIKAKDAGRRKFPEPDACDAKKNGKNASKTLPYLPFPMMQKILSSLLVINIRASGRRRSFRRRRKCSKNNDNRFFNNFKLYFTLITARREAERNFSKEIFQSPLIFKRILR